MPWPREYPGAAIASRLYAVEGGSSLDELDCFGAGPGVVFIVHSERRSALELMGRIDVPKVGKILSWSKLSVRRADQGSEKGKDSGAQRDPWKGCR